MLGKENQKVHLLPWTLIYNKSPLPYHIEAQREYVTPWLGYMFLLTFSSVHKSTYSQILYSIIKPWFLHLMVSTAFGSIGITAFYALSCTGLRNIYWFPYFCVISQVSFVLNFVFD